MKNYSSYGFYHLPKETILEIQDIVGQPYFFQTLLNIGTIFILDSEKLYHSIDRGRNIRILNHENFNNQIFTNGTKPFKSNIKQIISWKNGFFMIIESYNSIYMGHDDINPSFCLSSNVLDENDGVVFLEYFIFTLKFNSIGYWEKRPLKDNNRVTANNFCKFSWELLDERSNQRKLIYMDIQNTSLTHEIISSDPLMANDLVIILIKRLENY